MIHLVKEEGECNDMKALDAKYKGFQKDFQSKLKYIKGQLKQGLKQLPKE